MQPFKLNINDYLTTETTGYYSTEYTRFGRTLNPRADEISEHLRTCKNRFNDKTIDELTDAQALIPILKAALSTIQKKENFEKPCIINVPRAKRPEMYFDAQLLFSKFVCEASELANFPYIEALRVKNTKTTHIKDERFGMVFKQKIDEQPKPYPGISRETCQIKGDIQGKNIILVDDIYTRNANIDEDFVQFLYNQGANRVILYCVGAVL